MTHYGGRVSAARDRVVTSRGVTASRRPTLWEAGQGPARRLGVLALATTLTAVALDVAWGGSVGLLFDLGFVMVCVGLALAVRPRDFFTVALTPPLLMLGVVILLAAADPGTIADPADPPVQAVVTGLAHHAGALIVGDGLCLAILAIRHRVRAARVVSAGRRPERGGGRGQKRAGSPAPTRSTSG